LIRVVVLVLVVVFNGTGVRGLVAGRLLAGRPGVRWQNPYVRGGCLTRKVSSCCE
jgi:hypothetical protein